jgi:hypothetical protein
MKYLLVLLLLSGPAFAQSSQRVPAISMPPTKAAPLPVAVAQMSELDYYKKMYEQSKESAEASNTQTWAALAVVAGLTGIIILIQSISSYRINTSKIKGEVATQSVEVQRAILAAVSAQVAADVLANQTRIQGLEVQLREAINRELDAYNAAAQTALSTYQAQLQEGLSNQFELSRDLMNAEKLFAKGEYLNAFRTMLGVAEIRVAQKPSDGNAGFMLWPFLKALQEIQESDLNRLTALIEQLKGGGTLSYSFLADSLGKLQIYRLGRSGNEYLPNPFAPRT